MASTIATTSPSRTASWIGGVALLLIAILARVSYGAIITPLLSGNDALTVAHNIAASESQFRVAVLLLIVAAVLDIVVAAALLSLFRSINMIVATTASWFRVAYSAVFLVAISQLALVPSLLESPELVHASLDAYTMIWQVGLIPVVNDLPLRPFGLPFPMFWQMLGILVTTTVIGIVLRLDRRLEAADAAAATAAAAGSAPVRTNSLQ